MVLLMLYHFGLQMTWILYELRILFKINGSEKDRQSDEHYLEGNRKVILTVGELTWASWSFGNLSVIQ